ncbi:cell wall metabolism sensor histidine kinase WalK [Natribacillus halophilus]|uniref:histidine kinase n=1 Tax=Natribacillus halophilus TaxID=549003 RepID=A0A1G8L0L5_9BACI|nr:cell wall metabolism sensor histidine kinase WalK [Natribacillus halophilus]SDI49285.1 PAS/PAC sensor signal transduction histidine kinase [Natribacillus halophilus]
MEKLKGFFKSFQFKLIFIYVMLLFIALQVIGVFFMDRLEEQFVENHREALEDQMSLLSYNTEQVLMQADGDDENETDISEELNDLFSRYAVNEVSGTGTTIQVVDSQQNILAHNQPGTQNDGLLNTEIRVSQALLDEDTNEIMLDSDTGHRIRVITEPLHDNDDQVIGAIHLEASMEDMYGEVAQINNILMTSGGVALAITAALGILLSRTVTRPIKDMQKQSAVMSEGDYSRRVRVYGNDEIGELASSFNTLAMNLKEANATTEGERRKLSSVLSNMTDGVIATNELGHIILLNKRAEILLSLNSEEAKGKPLPEILHLSERLSPSDLYDYSEPVVLDFSDEGEDFVLEASFSEIRNKNGAITGLISVLHDITEQEKLDRDRREFVANVSHELRTPLTTLKSYMEALEEGAMADENLAPRFLGVIQVETDRMIRLVNDLLQLSRMDVQGHSIQTLEYDLVSWLHDVVDRFEMLTRDRNMTLVRDFIQMPLQVNIDSDKMTQVLDNIISNALKFSPEGGTITVGADLTGEKALVYIEDEGQGIPKKDEHKIFERFYRLDKARARSLGGTGLGLAIAKELVEAHGGSIWASGASGQGTRITLSLPYNSYPEVGESSD